MDVDADAATDGTHTSASLNRELAFVRRAYNVAIDDQIIETNPVKSKLFFKENSARVRFLLDDEEARLRDAIGSDNWPFVEVALHTGLRRSEQFHRRWENVDFANGILTVPRSKHGEARRVPLNDGSDILREFPSRLKAPYVFASATGATSVDACNFVRRTFVPALGGAGTEGFRRHDLRSRSRAVSRWRASISAPCRR